MSAYIGTYFDGKQETPATGDTFNQCFSRLQDVISDALGKEHPLTTEQREKLRRFGYVNLGDGVSASLSFDHVNYNPIFVGGQWIGVPNGSKSPAPADSYIITDEIETEQMELAGL